jgi:hypothetical protein
MKKHIVWIVLGIFIFPMSTFAAIALDGAYGSETLGGTSVSYSHNVTSSTSTILLVGVSGGFEPTSVTYNGISMTQIEDHETGGSTMWLYGLLSPTTGSRIVAVTLGTSTDIRVVSASYSGVNQSLSLDSIGDRQNSDDPSTSLVSTTTSVADNAWMFVLGGVQRNPIAGTNSTQRVNAGSALAFFDSNGPISPAGGYSMTYTYSTCSAACMSSIYGTLAPSTSTPSTSNEITGSGTNNRLAKFTASTTIANALLSDDGSNTTLTSGNFLMSASSLLDTITNGAISFGTSMATTMTFGRSGQNLIINSNVGIGTSTPSSKLHVEGDLKTNSLSTVSNCVSSASPAVCGSAPAGSVAMATGGDTLTVNTTAVTANSQIMITEDSSLGSRLGITCNTTVNRTYSISSRTASTSFTIKSSNNPNTNKACLSYWIVN